MILETTFLIDLQRELHRGESGPAQTFLARHEQSPLHVTPIITGELACGVPADRREEWEWFTAPFRVLPCTADVTWQYGQAFRYLKANGLLIGSNDLWIAATGVAFDVPVVTRNVKHYRRVPQLIVLEYDTA